MPKKPQRGYMKKRPQKYVKKYKPKVQRLITVRNTQNLMADRELVKLTYIDNETPILDTGVGTYNTATYAGNGIYDANTHFGGAQNVALFATMNNKYARYRVSGVAYDIQLINNTTYGTFFSVVPSNDVLGITNIDRAFIVQGNPNVKTVVLSSYNGGKVHARLKGFVRWAKIHGDSTEYNSDTLYSGTASSNPTNLKYLSLVWGALDQATVGMQILCKIKLTYYVEFFQRKLIVDQ